MPQKLSAMNYIKNNKRRVSVLIVSLLLCFVFSYITQVLLSTTTETFRSVLIENGKKIQYFYLPASTYGLVYEEGMDVDAYLNQFYEQEIHLADALKKVEGIQDTIFVELYYAELVSVVGTYYLEIPLVEQEKLQELLAHMDAELIEGRLPENDFEVVLDENSMKNNRYQIGDSLNSFNNSKIVGVLDCDNYFGCGVFEGSTYSNGQICVLSDGSITDLTSLLHDMGYDFQISDANIIDLKQGEEILQKDIVDVISYSTNTIFIAIIVIMSILLLIVYIMHLRDRQNEWCLYCSIGFSRKSIYLSIMRELLFTFGFAIVLGIVIILVSEIAIDYAIIRPLGLMCRYFDPECFAQIFCSFVLILGILQIPIHFAMHRIRTIDAIEDDLI